MLVAIADTPEELRGEILKLLIFAEKTQRTQSEQRTAVRGKMAARHAANVLQNVVEDVKRIGILPKTELKRGEDPTS